MSLRVYVSYAASALHGKCCFKKVPHWKYNKKNNEYNGKIGSLPYETQ